MNCPCIKSELSLFDKHPIQNVILKGNFEEIYPINPIDNGPIEFSFHSSDSDMFDLNDTLLEVKGNVKYSDDTNLVAADTHVTPSKLFLYSLFSDVSIHLNEYKIEGGNFLHPYEAIFLKTLQHENQYKKTQLGACGWLTNNSDVKESKTFQYIGSLCSSFFNQGRYLLNQTHLRIRLSRHKPTFILQNSQALPQGKTDYKIDLTEVILHVRRCKINLSVLLGHEQGLMRQPVIYPIQHTELITYTVSAGLKSVSQDNIFSGLSPKLIVVGIVANDAFNGTYKSDPFNFEHFNLTMASLYVNGDPINYKMDFTNNLSKHAYISMFQSLNMLQDNSNGLTYEKWCNGNTLLVFNLCPDMTFDGEHGQPKSRPNIRLQLQFEKAVSKSFNIILMALMDGIVSINRDRLVSIDY